MYEARYNGEVFYSPNVPELTALDQTCTVAVDGPSSYEFTLPSTNPFCGKLELSKYREVCLYEDGDLLFCGRVASLEQGFNGSVKYTCEGERAYLNDVCLPPYTPGVDCPADAAGFFNWAVGEYNAQVPEAARLYVGKNDGLRLQPEGFVIEADESRSTCWEAIRSLLIDELGGFVRTRREAGVRVIDWLADGTRECAQRVEFGVNLTDYTREVDAASAYTRITPWCQTPEKEESEDAEEESEPTEEEDAPAYWDISGEADRPLIEGFEKLGRSVIRVADELARGCVEKVLECPQGTEPAQMVLMAQQELVNSRFGDTLTVSAVDLHKVDPSVQPFRAGDLVRVTSAPHGYDAYLLCREIEIRPTEATTTYTLGAAYDTLTGQQSDKIRRLNASINSAFESTSALSAEAKAAALRAAQAQAEIAVVREETTTNLRLDSSRGTVFKNDSVSTVLSAVVYRGKDRIITGAQLKEVMGPTAHLEWKWQRVDDDSFGTILSTDPRLSSDGFSFTLSPADVDTKVTFLCQLIV